MDPVTVLGIANAAANLGLKCVSIVHALHTAAERFKTAELAILSLVEECSTIELAWDQLRLYVQTDLAAVPENEQIVRRIQRSLYAGELVVEALQKDLDDALAAPLKSSLLQRTKVVWKEETLKDHQSRIRGQVGALTLLLQVIKLYVPILRGRMRKRKKNNKLTAARRPRPTERERLLAVKARVFDDSDASAYSIVPSMRDAASICSSRATRTTAVTETGDDIRYIPFDFEDSLFTSWVYKRNFRPPATAEPSPSSIRFPLRRRAPRSPRDNADGQSVTGPPPSGDGGSDAVSFATSTGSSTSQSASQGSSVRTRPSLASPITPVGSSGRTSFSSATTSPAPEADDKLAKLFEVMVSRTAPPHGQTKQLIHAPSGPAQRRSGTEEKRVDERCIRRLSAFKRGRGLSISLPQFCIYQTVVNSCYGSYNTLLAFRFKNDFQSAAQFALSRLSSSLTICPSDCQVEAERLPDNQGKQSRAEAPNPTVRRRHQSARKCRNAAAPRSTPPWTRRAGGP